MEQRMHKRESERAQKKLFVAMDGWWRTKAVQSKRSRTGLAPLTARRPLFRSVCAIHVVFVSKEWRKGSTPVERTTTVRDDGITSSTAFRLYVMGSSMAADQAFVGQQVIARDGIFHCRCSSSVLFLCGEGICERVS